MVETLVLLGYFLLFLPSTASSFFSSGRKWNDGQSEKMARGPGEH